MTKLFRNDSPGALTLEQARTLEIKRLRERRRQAEELAAQGRGEDTEIAHVARGEIVVPEALQTPELLDAVRRAAAEQDIPFESLCVGNRANSINPNTGMTEFAPLDDRVVPLPIVGSYGTNNRMSAEGRDILARREVPGGQPMTHFDQAGNLTTGIGNKGPLDGTAQEVYGRKVAEADAAVNRLIKVPLMQAEHDALSSLVYNIGQGNFATSSMPGLINAGKFQEAADLFPKFAYYTDKATGQKVFSRGLENRGNAQRDQFQSNTLNVTAKRLP